MDPSEFRAILPSREEFGRLFNSTGWNNEYRLDDDRLFEAIKQSWYAISAYHFETLVGFGRIICDGVLHAFIVDVIVLPEYQSKGIGRALMEHLMEYCRSRNIRDIQLFCANGKVAFYEKLGFVKRPENAPGMELKS
jgi:ribosomal protein S18 acetylase RimI-like enzyme